MDKAKVTEMLNRIEDRAAVFWVSKVARKRLLDIVEATVPEDRVGGAKSLVNEVLRDLEHAIKDEVQDVREEAFGSEHD